MIENYYTPDQMEYLKKHGIRSATTASSKCNKNGWADRSGRAGKCKGTATALGPGTGACWQGLINEFTGGDSGIEQSVGRLWKDQGDNLVAKYGIQYDWRDVFDYIGPALAAVKTSGDRCPGLPDPNASSPCDYSGRGRSSVSHRDRWTLPGSYNLVVRAGQQVQSRTTKSACLPGSGPTRSSRNQKMGVVDRIEADRLLFAGEHLRGAAVDRTTFARHA